MHGLDVLSTSSLFAFVGWLIFKSVVESVVDLLVGCGCMVNSTLVGWLYCCSVVS